MQALLGHPDIIFIVSCSHHARPPFLLIFLHPSVRPSLGVDYELLVRVVPHLQQLRRGGPAQPGVARRPAARVAAAASENLRNI